MRPAWQKRRRLDRCLPRLVRPKLFAQIERAGAAKRILAHHMCDWLTPACDLLLDRGMMWDGVIDLVSIRGAIESARFSGPQEVEIFSAENWWKRLAKRF